MAAIDFPASPAVNDQFVAAGVTFIFTGQGWIVKSVPITGLSDAPVDGQTYGRKDATWTPVIAAVAVPAGTVMLFWQTAAPVGWTRVTTHHDKALRVVGSTAGGVAGGTNAFSTVMAQTVVGSDTPSAAKTAAHFHDLQLSLNIGASGIERSMPNNAGNTNIANSSSIGSSSSHNHTIAMAIQYIDILLATKN